MAPSEFTQLIGRSPAYRISSPELLLRSSLGFFPDLAVTEPIT